MLLAATDDDRSILDPLFTPLRTERITLPNRFVMAPMTRKFAPGGVLPTGAPAYYRRRAEGGLGLIITEGAVPPHAVGHHSADVPDFPGAGAEIWRDVVGQVHDAGSKIFVQLWHAGLKRNPQDTANPREPSIGPSGVYPDGLLPARTMTERDIEEVIAAFASAARDAEQLGFDGVNLHGAHGYIIDQFFWSRTNLRSDGYNGDISGRTRFAVELIQAIRRSTGPGFSIMFRFSQTKNPHYDVKLVETPGELAQLLEPLAAAGVDIFDPSTRRFWLPEFEDSDLSLAGWTKKITGKPTMTIGSIGLETPMGGRRMEEIQDSKVSVTNLGRLMEMFSRGEFDLVGLGRSVLTNPSWPKLARAGRFDALHPYDQSAVADRLECANTTEIQGLA